MNSILFHRMEFVSPDTIVVRGVRAQIVRQRHDLQQGVTLAALEQGGDRLTVRVDHLGSEELRCTVLHRTAAPARPPLIACVGTPRPQTVKKVLQSSALFGVTELHFIRTLATEKNYLTSRSLREEEIAEEIELALEQGWDPIAPQVRVWQEHRQWEFELLPRLLTQYSGAELLIAHTPRTGVVPATVGPLPAERAVIALIGPEKGWSDQEVALCSDRGFRVTGLGPRILRVDTALTALCAQVALRRQDLPVP